MNVFSVTERVNCKLLRASGSTSQLGIGARKPSCPSLRRALCNGQSESPLTLYYSIAYTNSRDTLPITEGKFRLADFADADRDGPDRRNSPRRSRSPTATRLLGELRNASAQKVLPIRRSRNFATFIARIHIPFTTRTAPRSLDAPVVTDELRRVD